MSWDCWGSFAFKIPYETPERGELLEKIIEDAHLADIYGGVGWAAGIVRVVKKSDCIEIYSDNAENNPQAFDAILEEFYEKLTDNGFKIAKCELFYETDGEHLRGDFGEHGELVWFTLDDLRRFPANVLNAMEAFGDALMIKRNGADVLKQLDLVIELAKRLALAEIAGPDESAAMAFYRAKNKLASMINQLIKFPELPYAEN